MRPPAVFCKLLLLVLPSLFDAMAPPRTSLSVVVKQTTQESLLLAGRDAESQTVVRASLAKDR